MGQQTAAILPAIGPSSDLDRVRAKRTDKLWLEEERNKPEARFLILVDLKPVVTKTRHGGGMELSWFSVEDLAGFDIPTKEAFFLGQDDNGHSFFAVEVDLDRIVSVADPEERLKTRESIKTLSLQYRMQADQLSLAGEAYAMASWHKSRHCCGRCGAHTIMREGGWKRVCRSCGQEYFPRSDPAVIMAVSDGDHLLLAREIRFPDKLYSVLAGFVEPGESIEEAVRRETKEETGIDVAGVHYVSSQPWPFPHSLMIGCEGKATSTDITLDKLELESARWFTKEEVRQALEGTHPEGIYLPPASSIAHTLIKRFAES